MTQDSQIRDHQDVAVLQPADAHTPEDLGFTLPPPSRTSRTGVIVVLAILLGGGFAFGWSQRGKAHERTALPATTPRATRVQAIKPKVVDSDHALALPGTVRALEQTKIF